MGNIRLIGLFIIVFILFLSAKTSMVEVYKKGSDRAISATNDDKSCFVEDTAVEHINAAYGIPVMYDIPTKSSSLKPAGNKSKLLKYKTSGKSTYSICESQNDDDYTSAFCILPYFLTLSWLKRLNI